MTELDGNLIKLDSADEAERIYAAEDIGYADCVEGVAPLFRRLGEEQSRAVREAILGALEGIQDDSVIEGAIVLLASEDTFARNQGVELLRQRGSKAIPFLALAFPGSAKDQRKMLVDVLAGIDGPGATEIYNRALADPDLNVVITAVESLGNAGKTEFRGRIEELAGSANPMLVGACLETLAMIGNHHSLKAIRTQGGDGLPVAEFLLPSWLKMLGALGDETNLPEAVSLLGRESARLEAPIVNAIVEIWQQHLETPLPELLVEPLKSIVNNGSSSARYPALRLLGELQRFHGVAEFLASHPERLQDIAGLEENNVA